jgi:hypothetical protein
MTKLADEHDLVTSSLKGLPENTLAFRICVVGRSIEKIDAAIYGFVNQAKRGLIIHSTPGVTVAELPGPVADL